MSTLKELIYYCSEENPLGAVLLTGEWGCGKTYLIQTELAEALRGSHLIVRVSLFGINSINALNDAVHKEWLFVCTPFLGKLKKHREKLRKDNDLLSAVSMALRSVNPVAGGVASAMVAVDPLDYIPITPAVDDLATGEKKHVVLVFDDLERTKLDSMEVFGCINDYCENLGFKTIIVANEDFILASVLEDTPAFRIMKDKVIAHRVLYEPDFPEIVHAVIADRTWQSEQYTAFLLEQEQLILDAFALHPTAEGATFNKPHNIRSLICALKQFFRVYVHLDHYQVPDIEKYLYAFIVYVLIVKSGYVKDGIVFRKVENEDISVLYPHYSEAYMPDSVRKWIEYGVWNTDTFLSEVVGPRAEAETPPEQPKENR